VGEIMSERYRNSLEAPPCSDEVLERAFVDDEVVTSAWSAAGAVVADALSLEASAANPNEALVSMVRLLGARGLLRLTVPAAHGGHYPHVRSTALCLARERLGHASPLVELAFAMQGLGSYPISARGSEELRARFLPRVASGEYVAAFALTNITCSTARRYSFRMRELRISIQYSPQPRSRARKGA
jgi:acyl-CoA dehydrogenase